MFNCFKTQKTILTFECPICITECVRNQFILETCKHTICFDCIHSMYQNKNIHEWCNKCPLCREPFTHNDIKLINKNIKIENNLSVLISKINSKNPLMASVIQYHSKNIPNILEQASAINDFYEGKIDYARMRSIAI